MRSRPATAAALVALGLAGCGGSAHSSSSSSAASAPSSTASASEMGAGTGATSTSSSSTAAGPTSSSSTASTAAARRRTPGPDTDVRLPAAFAIASGGALQPPVIAAPKHTDVALTVVARDGRPHVLALDTPGRPVVRVPAHGRATLLLTRTPDGTYAVAVDHVSRGRLIIGAAPGP